MLNLYQNIKKYRLERHLTQTELAEKTGYSDKSMIAKIENGKIDLPQSKIEQFAERKDVGNQPQLHQMLGAVAAMPCTEYAVGGGQKQQCER